MLHVNANVLLSGDFLNIWSEIFLMTKVQHSTCSAGSRVWQFLCQVDTRPKPNSDIKKWNFWLQLSASFHVKVKWICCERWDNDFKHSSSCYCSTYWNTFPHLEYIFISDFPMNTVRIFFTIKLCVSHLRKLIGHPYFLWHSATRWALVPEKCSSNSHVWRQGSGKNTFASSQEHLLSH